ncbi:PT domain-containing protein [Aeromicrobium sp.]|uniref:PT domain-containing protein n=1 Tax=Aeromicrobium sp. TaxID=1871063 RepID=UPI0028B21898|nr:PT domain-containing protein [Aeromicrobium sp.]
MPRIMSFAAGAAVAATIVAGTIVGSTAWAGTSSEPIAPMATFDPELPRALGSGDLRRVFSYSCSLQGEGLDVEASSVRVEVESTISKEVDPGDTIPEQPFDVEVTLPDSAYDAVERLGATHQEWTMPVGLTMRAGHEAPVGLEPFDVAVPREPLVGVPWRLTMAGTLPPIAVPNLAHTPGGEWYQHELWLDMPSRLTVDGALQTPGGEIATTLACERPGDLALGGTWVTTWPRPTDTPPSTDPTTSPTTEPPPPGSVPVGPGELSREVAYQCAVTAGGLYLGIRDFTLAATADYPETAAPGDVLQARSLSVSWTASELLRQATTLLLGARSARSTAGGDAALSLTTAGRTSELERTAWDFPRSGVPEVANEPWTMSSQATIPPITAPQDAAGALWLGLPTAMRIDTTLFTADDSTIPMTADCTAASDRLLGGIALSGETDPTPPVLDVPDPPTGPTATPSTDTPPTDDPSTPPTDEPTTDPVPGPGGPIEVGPGTLSRTAAYRCAVNAGGLNLGVQAFTLAATTDYAETAQPGDVLQARPVSVRWTTNELLRQAMASLLGAREARATVTDAAWSFTTAGRTAELPATTLDLPRSRVPQTANNPWTMDGAGTIPAITAPQDAAGALWVGLPATFRIDATLFKADESTIPFVANCAAGRDRLLGGIALAGENDPSPPVLDEPQVPTDPTTTPPTGTPPTDTPSTSIPTVPTTQPTSEPTSEPTTQPPVDPTTVPTAEPTTQPTVAPTTQPTAPAMIQPTVKVGALGLFRSAVFTVGVSAKGALPTGTVVVKRGEKVVAKGRLFLGVTVLTAGQLPRGEHAFTIAYGGDARVAAKTVTRKLRIL